VYQNEIHLADWFVKADADTYVFPENIRHFVRKKGWVGTEDHYFGHKVYNRIVDRGIPIIVGAAVMFSQRTISRLAKLYTNMASEGDAMEAGRCVDRAAATEEVSTAVCLKSLGIEAEAALDNDQIMVMAFMVHAHMGMNRTKENHDDWYWKGMPESLKFGLDCCSPWPLAIHGNKDKTYLDRLHRTAYGKESLKQIIDGARPDFYGPQSKPAILEATQAWFLQVRENMQQELLVEAELEHPSSYANDKIVAENKKLMKWWIERWKDRGAKMPVEESAHHLEMG
jgi:hypothetical protein